jgi:hypothetical protein
MRRMGGARRRSRAERREREARAGGGQARLLRAVGRQVQYARTVLAGLLAAAAVAAFALVVAFAGPSRGTAGSSTGSTAGHGVASPQWVALPSTSAAALQQAVRTSRLYQEVWNSPQTRAGQALRAGMLGMPVLVHAYRPTPGMLDVWVVPVVSAAAPGVVVGNSTGPRVIMLLDFAYDAAHRRMRPLTFAGPFVPGDPEFGQPFPRQMAAQALAVVRAAKGSAAVASARAELVYFAANLDALNGPHPAVRWTGGGQFPDLAIWRIVPAGGGPEGADYLVGLDGRVYVPRQLPWARPVGP